MEPKTLVIVPALNEELALPGVLQDLRRTVPGYDVIVIDDYSTDSTARVARAEGVAVASLPFNLGVGGALRTGFKWAVKHGYERAVHFDGDGQHSAEEIPRLIELLGSGVDLAIGSRFAGTEGDYKVGLIRRAAMRVMRIALRLAGDIRLTDTSSGFRAFSQDLIAFFSTTYPVEYLGDTVEAVLLARIHGFQIAEVPVKMRVRELGQPSLRSLGLIYPYLRLLIVIILTVPIRARLRRRGDAKWT